jgi:hypothetical protein
MSASAARNRERSHLLSLEVRRGQRGHLAGAENEDVQAIESTENLPRKGYRRITHRDCPFGEACFGPHALGRGKRGVKEPIQGTAGCLFFGGDLVGVLHLPEDLRFADDERVEACCHAEQVPRRVRVGSRIQVRVQRLSRDAVIVAHERRNLFERTLAVLVGLCVNLHAVARRDDDPLAALHARGERRHRRSHVAAREVHLLAELYWRRAVTQANQEQTHQKLWLRVRKNPTGTKLRMTMANPIADSHAERFAPQPSRRESRWNE